MALYVYTLEQSVEWNSIVRSFKEYDVYWLCDYVKAFYLHGDGEPLLFYFANGDTRGINVVMKRDVAKDCRFCGKIPENEYFDFSTPYGYGGWIIEGDRTDILFNAYQDWLKCNKIICEFVRFHPLIKNHLKSNGFYSVVKLGEVVHMNLDSPEIIWSNIASKNRNVIRKAIKNGVKIYNGRFPEIFERFRSIYNDTMDKDNADLYYYFEPVFYKSILEDLSQNAQIFWAEKDGVVIAASIMLIANGKMNYHLSGSVKEYGFLAPTNLLLYQAGLWGCANGCKTLYLGGGVGSAEDTLFKFKRAFYRGELNSFHIGHKIFDIQRYDELTKMRGFAEGDFFPKYRG